MHQMQCCGLAIHLLFLLLFCLKFTQEHVYLRCMYGFLKSKAREKMESHKKALPKPKHSLFESFGLQYSHLCSTKS